MDKEVVHIHNGILIRYKNITHAFESVLMRWIKLEPIIQSEVSQKEKHQYSILKHIHDVYRDSNSDLICNTTKETRI